MIIIIIITIILFILFIYYNYIKIQILNLLLIKRGLITIDCFWYKISDFILYDSSGINLYYKLKKNNIDFYKTHMFGKKINILLNPKYIKPILDQSPYNFGPGELKYKFFKSFMEYNVGVSTGCPWARRRKINQDVLFTNKLHIDHIIFNKNINTSLENWRNLDVIKYSNFRNVAIKIVNYIIFGVEKIDNSIIDIFSEANKISFFKKNFKIPESIKNKYNYNINKFLKNPNQNSLIYYLVKTNYENIEELKHQIPHFIFPMMGIISVTIPRILLLLGNHPNILKKTILNIKNNYLRKIILETLRLNNPVITTFRTVNYDTIIGNTNFNAGEQILILNNPILRDPDVFKNPNKFIPDRWNSKLEDSYFNLTFNQGPQKCPGKDLTIFIIESFIINLFSIKKININSRIITKKININNIPQAINPCNLQFLFV
jgi:hypothetical protein